MKRKCLEKLVQWKNVDGRKPLILKGVRQVGKTFLLKEFGERFFQNVHYINFEQEKIACEQFEDSLKPKLLIDKLSFYLNARINIGEDLVIFDEIQACPNALTSLKYFCEELPELAICSAGSLLGLHLGSGSFPVGKVDRLTLYPMNFEEFLLALDDQRALEALVSIDAKSQLPEIVHRHLWERLKHYFIVGGLPEAVAVFAKHQDSLYLATEEVRKKQKILITDYFADIAKHCGKVNAMHIERTWRAVPEQLASSQDGSSSRFRFRGVVPGFSRYQQLVGAIDWLEATGLVVKVGITHKGQLPFSAFSKENMFKLLMFDCGILGALSGLNPKTIIEYDYGSYKGFFAENYVAQEFLAQGVEKLYCWQKDRAEVEFLREIDGRILPVEVKSGSSTRAKSLQLFAKKYASPYRTIMSAKSLTIDKANDVHNYPLYLAGRFPLNDSL